uniref:Vitellogenin n=1 Tax=Aceria tosichella TaxID=561515 RepID=A0A6G1SGJ7_9ACAR
MNKLTIALLLVSVCASACLARTSPQIRRPFKFTPGQTYIYEYRGRQWNGLAKLADQYAGLTIDCDVILQALPEGSGEEVMMKLNDVKVEQLHTQALDNNDIRKLNQGKEVNGRQLALYKEELSKPIRFTYANGRVVRFFAESRDAEWSVNIKKSILSLFQLDLAPTRIIKSPSRQSAEQVYGYQSEDLIRDTNEMPLVYPVYEESFGGICETNYEIDSVDNVDQQQQKQHQQRQQQQDQEQQEFTDVLNVTKTVNYKNCLTDPSVSYDRHSFKVNTQTIKGKLFGQQPTVATQNYYPMPEEIKQKYSNAYTGFDHQDNVASPAPVERHSYTKYNITTASKALVGRRSVPVSSQADMLLVEGIYSEAKVKYEADGDLIVSDTQQSLKLITCSPTVELARAVPDVSSMTAESVRQPSTEYQTIQCELTNQKLKFYQALWKYAQLKQQQQSPSTGASSQFYSHKMALPFALSASWYPIVATGQLTNEQSIERSLNPEQLAKSYETLLISLADDVLTEDVAQSKRAGEKVIRLVNIVAFMPKQKLIEVYDRIVDRIQQAKQQQLRTRGKQAIIDNGEVAKWKVVRKLCLDSLPLAGSKQAIEMIELLIESNRVQSWEAKELVEAVPANLRYPDTEIIDAFIRMSQMQQVRKSRSLFASCSIAVGKMIGQAYAKSKDASYKPTTYERSNKLPSHLREDEIVKQVVEEADPRRQLPVDWNQADNQELYERLVLDEQDLTKYVMLYKQMLNKASEFHEKVIYLETLAHMKVPQVLPILEPFVTGRLSLAQCLGNQPLDINRPIEQSQWYNIYGASRQQQQQQHYKQRKQQQQQQQQQNQKDWDEEDSYGAEECNYMRTIAIYAMAHVAHWSPNKVQALLLPVFDNTYEPYQIRIAAFTTIMLTPVEEHILERIASQMWREPNKEVASFVVGTIDTMSKMTSPSMAAYKQAAMKAADSMPKQYLDSYKHSWLAGGDHFNAQKQVGKTWIAEIIKSNVSSIPRAAYWRSGHTHGPAGSKFDNHFELGFTSKGLESFIKSYIEYNKQKQDDQTNLVASILENLYDAKEDIVKYYYEARDQMKSSLLGNQEQKLAQGESFVENYFYKRQQPIDGVNSQSGKQSRKTSDLFEGNQRSKRSTTITFQARSSKDDDEEPKLTIFSKLFDSTSYHALDKKQLIKLIENCDDYLKMVADELVLGGKLHYVKMLMPSNMWHMVPSQLGLPIVVTHRTPIIASIKIDGSQNGQLTSTKLSQYLRQQATGQRVPNVQGQNFAVMDGINITALVHPKIMYSNQRFMFAVEQANSEAYGVQTEKSRQISLPIEVSVAYSHEKQLVSFSAQPKTPTRMGWTKEAAKTFIGQLALGSSQPDNWLGQEHLIRVPSKQAQYQRQQRAELYVPSLLASVTSLLNEPRDQQTKAIEDLETPYKFEHRAVQQQLGLECYIEGATDDEDVARMVGKPELVNKRSFGQLQWSNTDEIDNLDQHTKSGPLGHYLHLLDSASSRPSKYLEYYTTLKPDQPHKSPVYRVNFELDDKTNNNKHQRVSAVDDDDEQDDTTTTAEARYVQQQQKQQQQQAMINNVAASRRTINSRLDAARSWESVDQNKINQISRQQNMVEVY